MSLCIGRISYLPADTQLAGIRFNAQQRSLSSIIEIKPDSVPIYIVCQNYPQTLNFENLQCEEEWFTQQRIDKPPLGPAGARNVLLRQFYNSDYDYMLVMDDDVSLYDYYSIDNLLEQLDTCSGDFIKNNIHCIKAIEPAYMPFKKINETLPIKNYHIFCQAPMGNGGALFLLANLKKIYNNEIYFDETLEVKAYKEREDVDFFIRLMQSGYTVLECREMIQKNIGVGPDKSTVYHNCEDIDDASNTAMRNTAARLGIPIKNNRVCFSKALNFYKGYIKIPRQKEWDGQKPKPYRGPKKPEVFNLLDKSL